MAGASTSPRTAVVVGIPAQNESERIGACLEALIGQVELGSTHVGLLVFINNSQDDTAAVVAAAMARSPGRIRMMEVESPQASAGWARRCALEAAADWLREFDVDRRILLTTDADSCVGNDWIRRNLDHFDTGADAVAGRLDLDPRDAAMLPDALRERGRAEHAYQTLSIELAARIDPDPSDPWPCHWTECGASLAVELTAYQAVGGVPAIPAGEDCALVAALRRADYRVRHAPDITVVTSGRLVGRAVGGVATTIARRIAEPQSHCDDRLERAIRVAARAVMRRYLRFLFRTGRHTRVWLWAPLAGVSFTAARTLATAASWGAFQADVEMAPRFAFKPLRPAGLRRQISYARLLVGALRFMTERGERRGGKVALGLAPRAKQPQPSPP